MMLQPTQSNPVLDETSSVSIADPPAAVQAAVAHPIRYRGSDQLDALRGLAVLMVLVHHFFSIRRPLGHFGVQIFLTLSGLLITDLLLRTRADFQRGAAPLWFSARQFYLRRVLRIVPAFYALVVLAVALNVKPMRETLGWHASFLMNYKAALDNVFLGPIGHLWTLAVEVQFYLIWPWVILLTPKRALVAVVVLCAAAAPVYRVAIYEAGGGALWRITATPALLDCFALGGLIALLKSTPGPALKRLRAVGLWVALPAFLLLFYFDAELNGFARALWLPTASALTACALVAGAMSGYGGWLGGVLQWRPLVYVGVISYGLYLFHNITPVGLRRVLPAGTTSAIVIPLAFGASFALAALSWHFLERPINDLKRFVPYRKAPRN